MRAQEPDPGEVTRLLRRLGTGDAQAGEALLGVLYDELHALARRMMEAERRGHTLQPTALVHEAWLRLAAGGTVEIEDRGHFQRLAARAMRRVLVDHARARAAAKRAGAAADEPSSLCLAFESEAADVLALDEALARLETRDAEAARIVELRFFTGLSSAETAAVLGRSLREVEGGWVFARGWLRRELGRGLERG